MGFRKITFFIIATRLPLCRGRVRGRSSWHGWRQTKSLQRCHTFLHRPHAASNTASSCVYRHHWLRCVKLSDRLPDRQQILT